MSNDVEWLLRNRLFVIVNDVPIHVRILLHGEYLIHVVDSKCNLKFLNFFRDFLFTNRC
jgi:hypothetical protein